MANLDFSNLDAAFLVLLRGVGLWFLDVLATPMINGRHRQCCCIVLQSLTRELVREKSIPHSRCNTKSLIQNFIR